MRSAIFILIVCLAKTPGRAQFAVEWVTNCGNLEINSILPFQNKVYFSAEQSFGAIRNEDGSKLFSHTLDASRITNLQIQNNHVNISGSPTSGSFNLNGTPIFTTTLVWPDNSVLYTKKSILYNSSRYSIRTFKTIMKHTVSGALTWSVDIASSGSNEKFLLADNHLYLYSVVYNSSEGGILKYDTLGNRIWRVDPGMFVYNIVTDSQGNCFVLGDMIGGLAHILKINRDGEKVWINSYNDIILQNGMVKGDSLYVCGKDVTSKKSMYMIVSVASGDEMERQTFDIDTQYMAENATQIFATDDAIYVGGDYGAYYTRFAYIAKFSDPRFVSIKENAESDKAIKVFPNPAHEEINIRVLNPERSQTIKVRLRDQLGRMIVQQDHQPGEFSSQDLKLKVRDAKGLYLLTVNDGRTTFTEKVIFN